MKLYGKEDSLLTLQCKNITAGPFKSVVWLTNAYSSKAKYAAFSYDNKGKTFIDKHFTDRVKRVNGTSIELHNVRLADSGNWECNIIYSYILKGNDGVARKRERVKVLASYDVVVVSKLLPFYCLCV